MGLRKGASIMYDKGVIDANTKVDIEQIIEGASAKEFEPLLYVIPVNDKLRKRIITVAVGSKANPLSEEYQIVDLTKTEFDIIQF